MNLNSFNAVLDTINEIPSIRRVYLTGGEPLLNKNVFKFASLVKQSNKTPILMTNGILIDRFLDSIKNFFKGLWISLDGPNSEVINYVNNKNIHNCLIRGISKLKSYAPELYLVACLTIQRANIRHIFDSMIFAKKLGFNRVNFQALDTSSNAFGRDRCQVKDLKYLLCNRSELKLLEVELEKVKRGRNIIEIDNDDESLDYILKYMVMSLELDRSGKKLGGPANYQKRAW